MNCPSCGSDVPPNANWCPQCGYGGGTVVAKTGPTFALVGVLLALLAIAISFIIGKTAERAASETASESAASTIAVGQRVGKEGPFEVYVSERANPSIRIGNASNITLVFAVEDENGQRYTMEVPPDSNNAIDVPVGTYRAEVLDPRGIIRSAHGTANLQSHREYRADFTVGFGGGEGFYIGD